MNSKRELTKEEAKMLIDAADAILSDPEFPKLMGHAMWEGMKAYRKSIKEAEIDI